MTILCIMIFNMHLYLKLPQLTDLPKTIPPFQVTGINKVSVGDVITRHNQLRDCIADFCHKACLSPQIEKGSGILPKDQSRPADILVPNWSLSCPAAFDIMVINPLNLQFIQEAAQTCGHAAEMGEEAKHSRNGEACALGGWSCIPLVVEVFGGWGNEAINVRLAISK